MVYENDKNNTRNEANTCPRGLLIPEIMLPFYLLLKNVCILFPFKMHFKSTYTPAYWKLQFTHKTQKCLVHSWRKKSTIQKKRKGNSNFSVIHIYVLCQGIFEEAICMALASMRLRNINTELTWKIKAKEQSNTVATHGTLGIPYTFEDTATMQIPSQWLVYH